MAAPSNGLASRSQSTLATVEEVLGVLSARYRNDDVLTAIKHFPARQAQFRPMPAWVRPELAAAYRSKGIERLYSHQAAAAELARGLKDFVVVTPTASGKTLCYNLPILNSVLENSDTRALYLFPTKALAQDQLAELHDLAERLQEGPPGRRLGEPGGTGSFGVFTYDGDTPSDARKAIRERAHVILTNPDMLHTGILPHHTKWMRLFENLRYIVIDELHTYRGVFGSHLANVLRRLARIARFYGSAPQFIGCSATIANPGELAAQLIERPVETVDENGAPAAEKLFVFYNPPMVNRNLGIRRSYLNETARVSKELLARKLQTIVFANSRLHTEVLLTYLQRANPPQAGAAEPIRGYRGGYLPGERREIERGLREGCVRGVVATSALELGIDIGSLDACVMAGYAGSIASTWQRAGRAGRRSGTSCAVFVASSAPLDQFIVQHPDYFFGRSPEHAYIQPDNLEILVNHLKCAAFELPLTPDEQFGAVDLSNLCERLAEAAFLHRSGGNWHWVQEAYPADTVSLRSVTSDNFVIVETAAEDDGNINRFKKGGPEVIGEVDFSSALTTVHPKAIYLHQGQQYHVERLDFQQRKAYVKPVSVDYYTDAIRYTQVRVLEIAEEERIASLQLDEPSFRVRQGTASAVPNGADTDLSFRAERPDAFASPDEVRSGPAARRGVCVPNAVAGNISSIAPLPPPATEVRGLGGRSFRQGTASAVPTRTYPSGVSTPEVLPVASSASRAHGDVLVRSQVIGFKKIKFFTNENVGDGKLELPENEMHTTAFWVTLDRNLLASLPFPLSDRQSGIFGLLYALESMAALLLMCDRRDLGTAVGERPASAGIETEWQEFTGSIRDGAATREFLEPNLYIYDAYPGGIGFSEPLYRVHDLLLRRTRELIAACPCENGCPSCVGPAGEKSERTKEAALAILERLCS
jgi:DEAD/DEAH box helicase domain-containing protein